jgi:hypothetical protein
LELGQVEGKRFGIKIIGGRFSYDSKPAVFVNMEIDALIIRKL